MSNSAIRALFSGSGAIAYNPSTGEFTLTLSAANVDASIESDGLKVVVAEGAVQDTEDFTGSGAGATVQLQAWLDAQQTATNLRAIDADVVHIAGTETITGQKTLSAGAIVSGGSFTSAVDFELTDNTKGIIMKKAGGTDRHRVSLNSYGMLIISDPLA